MDQQQPSAGEESPLGRPLSEVDTKVLTTDLEEGNLLRHLRDFIKAKGNDALTELWIEQVGKALPPGREHQHPHRKALVLNLLNELTPERRDKLSMNKSVFGKLRFELLEALEVLTRNDAHYTPPVPK